MKKKHIVLILSTLFIIVLAVFFIDLPTATVGEPVEFDFDVIDTDIVIKLNKKAINNKSASFMVLNNKEFEIVINNEDIDLQDLHHFDIPSTIIVSHLTILLAFLAFLSIYTFPR